MEENKELLKEQVLEAIKSRNAKVLKEIFETVPNIDIAEAIEDVDDAAQLLYIFRVVDNEYSAEFFAELSTDQQELVIKAFSDKELMMLISESYADDIADTIQEMPANIVSRVLKVCPKDGINSFCIFTFDTNGFNCVFYCDIFFHFDVLSGHYATGSAVFVIQKAINIIS